MANIIDLVNPSTFNSSEWIGKGKKYDIKTLPYAAIEACTSATIIPAEYKKEFPSYHLSVLEFLKIPLPASSAALVSVHATGWFSKDVADKNVSYLMSRPLPSANTLQELMKAFGQSWLDGAQSLVDPRYNNETNVLPLVSARRTQRPQKS